MSRFDQRVREALSDPEFAAGYWEADTEIENITASRSRIIVLSSTATMPAEQSSVGMSVRIYGLSVQSTISWNPDVQLLGDRATA